MSGRFCTGCGTALPEGLKFCNQCGKAAETDTQPQAVPPVEPTRPAAPVKPAFQQPVDMQPPKGSRYAVLGVGSYLLAGLIMMVPVVNIIMLFIWSFGSGQNLNKRNMARAMLIMVVIGIVLSIILTVVLGSVFKMFSDWINDFSKNITY